MFKSITFEVSGDQKLVCEGCEERVEHALKTLEGVGKVRAHARNQRIDVLFDAAVLDADAIAEQVARSVGNLERRGVGAPPARLEAPDRCVQIVHAEYGKAARRGTVVGDQKQRACGDPERRDARAELREAPDLFGAQDVPVIRPVIVERPRPDVQIFELAERFHWVG